MTALITSDLHLTEEARDAYRWALFPWLRKQVEKYQVRELFLLGDLTDRKDRHPSVLVNRFASCIHDLAELCEVHILPGNHDSIERDQPFFMFMDHLKARHMVVFYLKPGGVDSSIGRCLLIPNAKKLEVPYDLSYYQYVFCHQTFDGAKAENGMELRGISPSLFKKAKQVYSGDIHVPQKVSKNIEYVGAPYRIKFGDTFKPRVLLLTKEGAKDLHFPGVSRELIVIRTLKDVEAFDFPKETQVKIRVRLKRRDFDEWPGLRKAVVKEARKRGWEICGLELRPIKTKPKANEEEVIEASLLTPEEELAQYALKQRLKPNMKKVGHELLKEAIEAS